MFYQDSTQIKVKQVGFLEQLSIQSPNPHSGKIQETIFQKGKMYEVREDFCHYVQEQNPEAMLNLTASELAVSVKWAYTHIKPEDIQ